MPILIPGVPLTEKLVRSAAGYLFLLVAFRLTGKRQLGQMTAFDLVVLPVICNVANILGGYGQLSVILRETAAA